MSKRVRLGALQKFATKDKVVDKVIDKYRILYVEDPDNIFVTGAKEETWEEDFQKCYNQASVTSRYVVRSTRIFKEHLYAYRDPATSRWCRVRVIGTDLITGRATVSLIDSGVSITLNSTDLLDLDEAFWPSPSRALKIKLSDVFPLQNLASWPLDSIQGLKMLLPIGQVVSGVLVDEANIRHQSSGTASFIYIVEAQGQPNTVSVQKMLADLGLALLVDRDTGSRKEYDDYPWKYFKTGYSQ